MLNHPDVTLRKEGFDLLNDSVFATKRFFSGAVGKTSFNNWMMICFEGATRHQALNGISRMLLADV